MDGRISGHMSLGTNFTLPNWENTLQDLPLKKLLGGGIYTSVLRDRRKRSRADRGCKMRRELQPPGELLLCMHLSRGFGTVQYRPTATGYSNLRLRITWFSSGLTFLCSRRYHPSRARIRDLTRIHPSIPVIIW